MSVLTDSVTILCGICLGTAGGFTLVSQVVPSDIQPPLPEQRASIPYHIEMRGEVRSYDAETETLFLTALSPYDNTTSINLSIKIDETARIVYTLDNRETTNEGVLKGLRTQAASLRDLRAGVRVDVSLRSVGETFVATQIRLFGHE